MKKHLLTAAPLILSAVSIYGSSTTLQNAPWATDSSRSQIQQETSAAFNESIAEEPVAEESGAVDEHLITFCRTTVQPENPVQNPPVEQPRRASDVYLASPNYKLGLQFTALYLQPTSNNLHYVAEALPLPVPTPNWRISDIDPDYRFGFEVGLDAVFHHTNTNLMLTWEHFHASDSQSKRVPDEDMLGPFFTIGPDASPYSKARGHVHFRFDEANLDYGVLVNLGSRIQTNLFAGVSYIQLKETLKSKYSSSDNTDTRSITTPSKFWGAGPQVGLSFAYRLVRGFQLTGDGSASLLVGSMRNKTTYKSTTPLLGPLGITPPNTQRTHVDRRTQVVPGLEGSLGLAYNAAFRKHYTIKIEAGYRAQLYINALQSVDMGSEVPLNTVEPTTVGVYARTFQRTLSNFALAGPYATLMLGF